MKKAGKFLILFILGLYIISLLSFGVVAQTPEDSAINDESGTTPDSATTKPLEKVADKAAGLLEKVKITPDTLSKILLGLLLWMIVFSIVKQIGFGGGKWGIGSAIFAAIVVLLALLWMPENFIQSIIMQYGAMGATILAVIPFIIMLYFTIAVSGSLLLSRIIWIFYIGYYFTLLIYKGASEVSDYTTYASWAPASPYIAAVIIGLTVFFGLPSLRNLFFKGKLDADEEKGLRDIKWRELGRKLERSETESRTGTTAP